ncbi:glycosyltransferase family 2 protein [Candidatus Omnitrophota bacterium]
MNRSRHLHNANNVNFKKDLVAIIIVNWNSSGYIEKCLDSVKNQTYPYIEVIVVDNNSTDGSLEYIMRTLPDVKIIKNSKNVGFSKAHNAGIGLSNGEYILPLNFDVFLEPNFIRAMVEVMESDSSIGTISGKLYKQINGKKSKIIDSTGIMMEYCFMRPRGEMEEDIGQYDNSDSFGIFGACGAAPFYRRSMLKDIRYFDEFFDEDFVNYVEDVDLSWRAQLRGWRCFYRSNAVCYHERGATRKSNNRMQKDYLIYGFRNRYCSTIKNMPKGYWDKYKFKIIGKELMFLLGHIKGVSYFVKLKALFLALKMLRKMLTKRKFIQGRKSVSDDYLDFFLRYRDLNFYKAVLTKMPLSFKSIISRLENTKDNTSTS